MTIKRISGLLILIATVIPAAGVGGQIVPSHVVISQVQIADDEFFEVYNATDRDVILTGWYWGYFSSTRRTWDDPWRNRQFPRGAIIPASGFYLIELHGTLPLEPDWSTGYKTGQLSNEKGTVAIFMGPPSEKMLVDAVGWGDVILKEGNAALAPEEGRSIVRRFVPHEDALFQDTDDNASDFTLQRPATSRSSRKAVILSIGPDTEMAAPGETIHHALNIANKGKEEARIVLKVEDEHGWRFTLEPEIMRIPAGRRAEATLTVRLPAAREFFALDLETTGLNPAEHEIIEIARVHFRGKEVVEEFTSLIRPQGTVPPEITQLTGITEEAVAMASSPEDVLPDILAALSGRIVVAHNAPFDRRFLEAAAYRLGLPFPPIQWVDTLKVAARLWPRLRRYDLGFLRTLCGLPEESEHRALPDAKTAGLLWLCALSRNRVTLTAVAEGTATPHAVTTAQAQVRQWDSPMSILWGTLVGDGRHRRRGTTLAERRPRPPLESSFPRRR